MFWDFIQQRPETTHHILKVFSDIGQPESFRMINGSVSAHVQTQWNTLRYFEVKIDNPIYFRECILSSL